VKNRFGSTNEIGVFEMKEKGLSEVENPSEIFLSGRPLGVPGTCVAASMEGTRPLLVELQALVTPSSFAIPKRMSTGIDYQRVTMLLAVLEKRMGLHLQNQDAYLNVVGGMKISEPAVDLAVAVALASSFKDQPTGAHDLFIGEVGLTGEVRGISRIEQRVTEACSMGFTRIILPNRNIKQIHQKKDQSVDLVGVESLGEAIQVGLR
jgi:DNA repair protein RadA/Sms